MLNHVSTNPVELPAITDWEDFQNWCRQERRQALPASDDTLMRYAAARAERDREAARPHDGLGWFAFVSAVSGVLLPILAYLILSATTGDPRLSQQGAVLFFVGLQLIALTTGWSTRASLPGRAAWRTACVVSLLVALAVYLPVEGMEVESLRGFVSR